MPKILITPVEGTARMINSQVLVGCVHYLAVNPVSIEIRNNLSMGYITQLDGVSLIDEVPLSTFKDTLRDLEKSKPQKEGEDRTDYHANNVRFVVEALNAEFAPVDVSKAKDEDKEKAAQVKKATAEAKKKADEASKEAVALSKASADTSAAIKE